MGGCECVVCVSMHRIYALHGLWINKIIFIAVVGLCVWMRTSMRCINFLVGECVAFASHFSCPSVMACACVFYRWRFGDCYLWGDLKKQKKSSSSSSHMRHAYIMGMVTCCLLSTTPEPHVRMSCTWVTCQTKTHETMRTHSSTYQPNTTILWRMANKYSVGSGIVSFAEFLKEKQKRQIYMHAGRLHLFSAQHLQRKLSAVLCASAQFDLIF